ncbi:MAG: bifunctional 4-hydroxy-2-oxoglutarate aldolase/2-dehydro-3-deoxy-phosphogluconate aldolase [Christensenellaceae bacterium]|jgi:2-dehydro-3-deoxyphosphogluconate aldolase/(4S)-4-hydroxy-2-oxoglutarate aldolase|nr:bifunctional 4-hydroxy-2-oxoglutarate aldolase/2-dehydro-3-deoxy-phosphogluconate aldolase [Christensenellaceae bacterium]
MSKYEVYKLIQEEKLVAVVRGNSADHAIDSVEKLINKGVKIIEITFTTPNATDVLECCTKKYKNSDVLFGSGTILDAQTARASIMCGAQFVVSPCVSCEVLKLCNIYSIAVIPGVYTPTEVVQALEYGVDFLKLFPADLKILKALQGPFPNVKFLTTGGVSIDNLKDWLEAGASAVGAGSELLKPNADIERWVKTIEEFIKKDGRK